MNNYTYFWGGPFSQWHPCNFTTTNNKSGQYDYGRITFNCAEQYMMFKKALLFEDHSTATLILGTTDPKRQKTLGRGIINFDKEIWEEVAKDIVYQGNIEKFSRNPALLKKLLATRDTLLVEASPYDKIWGIGLNEEDAKKTSTENWKGTNWLGEILTKVRNDLK